MDRDEDSGTVVERKHASRAIGKFADPIDRLPTVRRGTLAADPVYSIGWFERPPMAAARALVEQMFAMLKPGDSLLIMENGPVGGPVECGDYGLLALVAGIAGDDIADVELSSDAARNLVYLLVRRRDAMETTARHKRLRDAQAVFRAEWMKRIAPRR